MKPRDSYRLAAGAASLLWLVSSWPGAGQPPVEPEAHDSQWSLRPLRQPALPGGAGHPIDAFTDASLAELQLARSPEADRRTLIRRLAFGLTGLPPTPEAVDAFLRDADPAAYEKLVDRLLASPRYGEHWARHWLDVAQYADTHGNDHDYVRPNAWPYRDYVIASLNADKPYARFVQEQVAGDALFPDVPEATIALGFLAAGPWDDTLMVTIREDTVDHRIGQNLDRDGMVSAVMGSLQSLTVHCARCHDHKFDPVTQREYYALQAVFAGVDRAERPVDANAETHVRRTELRRRKREIEMQTPALLAALQGAEVHARVAAVEREYALRNARWKPLDTLCVTSTAAADATSFTREADGSWFVSGARPDKDTFVIEGATSLTGIRSIRLEVLPDPRLPAGGPGRYDNGNFHLAEVRVAAWRGTQQPDAGMEPVELIKVVADHADGADAAANVLDGNPDTYWSIHPRYNEAHEALFALRQPVGFEDGTRLSIGLDFTGKSGHQIGRFRLWVSTEPMGEDDRLAAPFPADMAALLRIAPAERTPEQQQQLALLVLEQDVNRSLAELPAPMMVYAATRDFVPQGSFKPAQEPRPIHLLVRGDINRPAELVEPGALGCISGLPPTLALPGGAGADESARRAALARWLADHRNALTWRSIVNRVWHWHFGRGICETPNDFGKMGGFPSHPELLDWLAVWFRDEAQGSLKQLHRLILTSATYRQSARGAADAIGNAALDSDNRMLSRMNRMRLSGEQVRDAVLQFSGRLDTRMGGPPAIHFLDKGDATFNPGGAPPFVDYDHFDHDSPDGARRAVYRFVFRTVPDPLMDALDCPDGSGTVPVRATSSTAQQALAMLNDAFLLRQSEHIAARISAVSPTTEGRVWEAFRIILQRVPDAGEHAEFTSYAHRHGLPNACHLLLNSNEFLFLD